MEELFEKALEILVHFVHLDLIKVQFLLDVEPATKFVELLDLSDGVDVF